MTPLLILAAWLELSHVGIRLEMLDREAQDKVRNIVANIDSQIDAQIAALEVLASSPLIDDPEHWPDFYTMALSFRAGFGGHVILSDTSMQMLLNTRSKLGSKLPKLPVPKGRAAAPLVLETGKPTVGDSFLGPIAGEQLIAVIVPVVRNDHIRYLLLGTIETRKYQELIDKMVIPPGWAVVLRDSSGKTMAHNSTAGMESTKNKTFYGKHFAARSRGSGWSITLEIPARVYLVPMLIEGAILFLGLVLAAIISFLGGRWFSRRLTRSVAGITERNPPASLRLRINEVENVHDQLFGAFTARDLSEIASRERGQLNKALVRHLPQHIFIKNTNAEYILCNDHYARALGIDPEAIEGKTDFDFYPVQTATALDSVDREIMANGVINVSEEKLRFQGEDRWFNTIKVPFKADDGKLIGLIGLLSDITERKATEEAIHRSLIEKENLIKELFHRTYNSLQLMQAIMILQAENHAETPLADFIRQVTQKIEVMAMVHRGLFHTGDLSRIDLSSYISEVIESVQNHFPSVGDRVVFERRLQAVMVLFDVAVPLGLVVYELLTNAFTHAFPDGRGGAIAIVLSKDQTDRITLELMDDGIGCNRAWSSPDNAKLGLQLVQSIVEGQLQGTITLEDGNGTGWKISFADIQYKERV